jgi:hypothetical protein
VSNHATSPVEHVSEQLEQHVVEVEHVLEQYVVERVLEQYMVEHVLKQHAVDLYWNSTWWNMY